MKSFVLMFFCLKLVSFVSFVSFCLLRLYNESNENRYIDYILFAGPAALCGGGGESGGGIDHPGSCAG